MNDQRDFFPPEPAVEVRIHAEPVVTEVLAKAKTERTAGKRAQLVLTLLLEAGAEGLIHREVDTRMAWPAVMGSRYLTMLHYAGHIVRTAIQRQGCLVYVHPRWWSASMGSIPPRRMTR